MHVTKTHVLMAVHAHRWEGPIFVDVPLIFQEETVKIVNV